MLTKADTNFWIKNILIDFDHGYEILKNIFGESIFLTESTVKEFISQEQIKQIHYLFSQNNLDDEKIQELLLKAQATKIEELDVEQAQKIIDFYEKKLISKTGE